MIIQSAIEVETTCVYLSHITEFRYTESYINGFGGSRGKIHFDISGYFVMSDFDIEGVDCMCIMELLYLTLPSA